MKSEPIAVSLTDFELDEVYVILASELELYELLKSTYQAQSSAAIEYVNNLIAWGIYADEPFAIRLGQKFYEATNHSVPTFLAEQISFYHSRLDYNSASVEKLNQTYSVLGYLKYEKHLDDITMHRKNDSQFGLALEDACLEAKFQNIYDLHVIRENTFMRQKEQALLKQDLSKQEFKPKVDLMQQSR
eukprot:TRINITY_DN1174_c0_g1_i2.p2 TRINITY_DN1174_c0_g1~~TRINITY_DN1174_c0_g1_i2.p2  ORF type:complete len:188 (+),score=19.21 TRINITY_DN1174_c0_g1_i2:506-1069(+)